MASESNMKDSKSSKRLSRALSLSSIFRKKSKAPLDNALPVVEEQTALPKTITVPEGTTQEGTDEGNTTQHIVVPQNDVESENKVAEVHIPEMPVDSTIENDSADNVKQGSEPNRKASSDDAAQPETDAVEGPTTEKPTVEGLNEEEKVNSQSERVPPSTDTKDQEDPATSTELRVDVPRAENQSEGNSKVEAVPDSAIDLPVVEAATTGGAKATQTVAEAEPATKKAVISSEPPAVIPAVADRPKETSKPSRRSSIFGRIGSLRSKRSFTKKPSIPLSSTSEDATGTKTSTPSMDKALDTEKKRAEIRPAQQLQRAKTAPVNNVALQQKVQTVLTQPSQLPMVREKEEKGAATKTEVTGSGFGQDVYF